MVVEPTSAPAEGLAWLGRDPDRPVPPFFKVLRRVVRFAAYRLAGWTLRVEGSGNRPEPPYIIAAAVHRSWLDALVLIETFPLEPRIWYIASGPAAFRTPFRRLFVRAVGGVLPVYRGGYTIEPSVASARAVMRAGAVLGFFPEGTRRGPRDALGPFRGGIGYLALRTGAQVVPVAMAGTQELYLRKRVAVRILPVIEPLGFVGLESVPAEGSREERDAARRITSGLRDMLEPHVLELIEWTTDPPDFPRRLRWMNGLYP